MTARRSADVTVGTARAARGVPLSFTTISASEDAVCR
jgi:hypothetical protein